MVTGKELVTKASSNRFTRCVNIAAEIAGLLVQIRGRPRFIDVIAVAAKSLDIGLRIREELVINTSGNPWDHFGLYKDNSSWTVLPNVFLSVLMPRVGKRKQITRNFDEKGPCAWEGEAQGIKVGWVAAGEQVDIAFVAREQEDKLAELVREAVWAIISTGHAVLKDGGLVADELEPARVVRTTIVKETHELVEAFLKVGERQSYLLVGDPGTGKTTAIQHVARALNLRSLRIPLGKLSEHRSRKSNSPTTAGESWTLGAVVAIAKPDILIVDDIDRADIRTQAELLEFVDSGRFSAKAFLASANDIRHIIPPLRRPERFDEHLSVPPLSLSERAELLGDLDKDVAGEMEGWPICYVAYYSKLVRVLGREKARAKIPELKKRISSALEVPKTPFNGSGNGLDHSFVAVR